MAARIPFPEPRPTGQPFSSTNRQTSSSASYPWPINLPRLPSLPRLDGSSLPPPIPEHRPNSAPGPGIAPYQCNDNQSSNSALNRSFPTDSPSPPPRKKNKLLKWLKRDRKSSHDSLSEQYVDSPRRVGGNEEGNGGSRYTKFNIQGLTEGMLGLKVEKGERPSVEESEKAVGPVKEVEVRDSRLSHSVSTPIFPNVPGKGWSGQIHEGNGYSPGQGPVINVHVHIPSSYSSQNLPSQRPQLSYTSHHSMAPFPYPIDNSPSHALHLRNQTEPIHPPSRIYRIHPAQSQQVPNGQRMSMASESRLSGRMVNRGMRPVSLASGGGSGNGNGIGNGSGDSLQARRFNRPAPILAKDLMSKSRTEEDDPRFSSQIQPPRPSIPHKPISAPTTSFSPPRQPTASPRDPTNGNPSNRARTQSETPSTPTSRRLQQQHPPLSWPRTPTGGNASTPISSPLGNGKALQCSGYTTKGQRCKRTVKGTAPVNNLVACEGTRYKEGRARFEGKGEDDHDDDSEEMDEEKEQQEEKRYCKDHLTKILTGSEGFYWKHPIPTRSTSSSSSDHPNSTHDTDAISTRRTWIQFNHFIPPDLDEQTKVLLRLCMEMPLTKGEGRGWVYCYELRDLETDEVAFYKVGRTDNVPRRLDEWKKRCTSHHPTPLEIFPSESRHLTREASYTNGKGNGFTSLLPGNMNGGVGVEGGGGIGCVKRMERLIHIELSARSPVPYPRKPCSDCGSIHKEIFPMRKLSKGVGNSGDVDGGGVGGGQEYEMVVREVICRWERFCRIVGDGV